MRAIAKIILFLVIITLIFMISFYFAFSKAHAHSWYSQFCCSGYDCTSIPASTVKTGKNGYELRLTPKEHPSLNTPFSYTVPYAKAQPSEDNEYHACILRSDPDTIRCLYTPNMGF